MKNTFKIKFISAFLIFSTLLGGCNGQGAESTTPPCEHVWADATCQAAKTCTECGATEGEALAHDWAEATPFVPKTCKACGTTEGEKLECPIPDRLNLALAIEKIPVATPDMTEDELRDIIVEFMNIQLNFAFTPDFGDTLDSYGYYIKNLYRPYRGSVDLKNAKITFEEGKYYGGIPYVGNAAGSLYRWLEFYDPETGVMNWDPIIRTKRKNWVSGDVTYPDVGSAIFGNSCSSSCVWSWLRVSNSISSFWTNGWVSANGFVKVGDYDLNDEDQQGDDTTELCKKNGKDKMFEAYAKVKKADGVVNSTHARMCASDAVVVRDSNGNIDGNKSYILIAEQDCQYLTAAPAAGGVPRFCPLNYKGDIYYILGSNYPGNIVNGALTDMKRSFNSLYQRGYLPFTIPELCGLDDVEKAEVGFYKSGELVTDDTIKVSELGSMTLKSNYAISDIHFIIRDSDGREAFNAMYAKLGNSVTELKSYEIRDAYFNNELYQSKGCININLYNYAELGGYTLEITARLSTGELLTVYKGKLTE